jgi:predicted GNAT superfamily acetyltransferase
MHKLTIKLINGTSPLEYIVFNGERVKEINVRDLDDFENIIDEATAFLNTIEGANTTIIGIRVLKENGGIILNGYFKDGMFVSGTIIS